MSESGDGLGVYIITPDRALGRAWSKSLAQGGWRVRLSARPECAPSGRCPGHGLALMDVRLLRDERSVANAAACGCSGLAVFSAGAELRPAEQALLLEAGAADVLPGAIDPALLRAKIRALARRAAPEAERGGAPERPGKALLTSPCGAVRADPARGLAWVRDQAGWRPVADLTELEHRLLCAMLVRAHRTVARQELLQAVWGEGAARLNEETLTKRVQRLRRKLGPAGGAIRTRYGRGYLFLE